MRIIWRGRGGSKGEIEKNGHCTKTAVTSRTCGVLGVRPRIKTLDRPVGKRNKT